MLERSTRLFSEGRNFPQDPLLERRLRRGDTTRAREGEVASSGGSGDDGGAAKHCKPGPRNQASYMDEDDMSDLLALNAGLVAAGVVAWCLH